MNIITKQVVKGLIKIALMTVGGVIVSRGYMDNDTMQQLIGAVMAAVGGFWTTTNNVTKVQIPKSVAHDSRVISAVNNTPDPFNLPPH